MNLILTSDFPSTPNVAVLAQMQCRGPRPRVAWIPPETETGRPRFPRAQEWFTAHGFQVDYCDIDQEPDTNQLAHLAAYDIVYLTGGNPLVFRENLRRVGLGERLRECLDAGRLLIGASSGALQFTPNVSLFRLTEAIPDDVIARYEAFTGLGFVPFEVLPHHNRLDPTFLEQVRLYSEQVPHDILCLSDGSALLCSETGWTATEPIQRFRLGVQEAIVGGS